MATVKKAEFSWAAAGDVGLGLLSGITGALGSWASGKVAQANADAANSIRESNDKVRASQSVLAGTIRTINNQRIGQTLAKNLDAGQTTLIRTAESFQRGNFEQSIRDSERLGAIMAGAATSGLGGSSIAALSSTAELSIARAQEQRESQQGDVTFDQARQLVGLHTAAYSAMDVSPIGGPMDRTRTTASSSDIMGSLLAGLASKKDSFKTLLGSFVQDKAQPEGAVSHPVQSSTLYPTAIDPMFAFSSPVSMPDLQATELPPLGQLGSSASVTIN